MNNDEGRFLTTGTHEDQTIFDFVWRGDPKSKNMQVPYMRIQRGSSIVEIPMGQMREFVEHIFQVGLKSLNYLWRVR